jgi:competence protein ComEA
MINLSKKQIVIAILIVMGMITIIGYYFYTTFQSSEDDIEIVATNTIEEENKTEEAEIEENHIIVHIAGEVKNAGIIKINEGARIADVIEMAGGLNEQADITNINLAYPVEDGQKITIPKIGQEDEEEQEYITTGSGTNDTSQQSTSKKININKATSEELQTLSGIRRINCRKNN